MRAEIISGAYPTAEQCAMCRKIGYKAAPVILQKNTMPKPATTSGQTVHIQVRGWQNIDWSGTDDESIKFLESIHLAKVAAMEADGWSTKKEFSPGPWHRYPHPNQVWFRHPKQNGWTRVVAVQGKSPIDTFKLEIKITTTPPVSLFESETYKRLYPQ